MFEKFPDWQAVLGHADRGKALYYQAPLDFRATRVAVRRIYKNGKIRLSPYSSDADDFTADAGHLDRFRREKP